jgi:hypothetical protein
MVERNEHGVPMLKALTVADALTIASISYRRTCDERAMVEYLGIGKTTTVGSHSIVPGALLKPTAIDLAAFESDERIRLRDALASLSIDARREFLALVWFARSPSLTFESALRRTRRIPADAQVGYLMGRRLEQSVAAGLEKLGFLRSQLP